MNTIPQHLLIFETDKQLYGLPLNTVREVVHMTELIRPPERPQFLQGFLNMGGQLIAVVDLRTLWNMPTQDSSLYTPLIMLAGQQYAFQVDRIDNVVTTPQEAYQSVEENHILNNCIEATCHLSEKTIYLLNVDQILLSEEELRLADLKQKTEKRLHQLEVQSS